MARTRSLRQSNSKRKGNRVEQMVCNRLKANGFLLVSHVYDHWRPIEPVRNGKWICAKGGDKLVGDVQAMAPGGKMVLVECKARSGNLVHSAFKAHQMEALEIVHSFGGIALVAWHDNVSHLHIMRWSEMGLTKGRGLKREQAFSLNIDNLRSLWQE